MERANAVAAVAIRGIATPSAMRTAGRARVRVLFIGGWVLNGAVFNHFVGDCKFGFVLLAEKHFGILLCLELPAMVKWCCAGNSVTSGLAGACLENLHRLASRIFGPRYDNSLHIRFLAQSIPKNFVYVNAPLCNL
jgi:hypothetical protein